MTFFRVLSKHLPRPYTLDNACSLLKNPQNLASMLRQMNLYRDNNHLADNFIRQVSSFTTQHPTIVNHYFHDRLSLNMLGQHFIHHCFQNNTPTDKEKTLASFKHHDALSDMAVKETLLKLPQQPHINLLGFGLGDGYYERSIRDFLLQTGIADHVTIYGFDPHADQVTDVTLLPSLALSQGQTPKFDIVIARWALHHVELVERWQHFSQSANMLAPRGIVLIVEHGFIPSPNHAIHEKLYYFLNATFDVVANIGIRPHWFLDDKRVASERFFIHYLDQTDLSHIMTKSQICFTQTKVELADTFPPQTVFTLQQTLLLP